MQLTAGVERVGLTPVGQLRPGIRTREGGGGGGGKLRARGEASRASAITRRVFEFGLTLVGVGSSIAVHACLHAFMVKLLEGWPKGWPFFYGE